MDKLRIESTEEAIHLSPIQGDFLKALIHKCTKLSHANFSTTIGMNKGLLSRYLTGDLRITPCALATILSGLSFEKDGQRYQYTAIWKTIVEIHPKLIGPAVPNADSTLQETTSLSEDSG